MRIELKGSGCSVKLKNVNPGECFLHDNGGVFIMTDSVVGDSICATNLQTGNFCIFPNREYAVRIKDAFVTNKKDGDK